MTKTVNKIVIKKHDLPANSSYKILIIMKENFENEQGRIRLPYAVQGPRAFDRGFLRLVAERTHSRSLKRTKAKSAAPEALRGPWVKRSK